MAINGIERIAERILRDAQTEAAGIQKVADENCAMIAAQYEKQAKDAAAQIQESAEKEAQEIIKRMKGEADMKARGAVLEEKQALMQKVFDMAQQEILLNQKDLDRYGAEFCDAVNEALAAAGRKACLTLCSEPADIDGGLKLKNGNVETNCSVSTLLAGERETLVPQVASMLFG